MKGTRFDIVLSSARKGRYVFRDLALVREAGTCIDTLVLEFAFPPNEENLGASRIRHAVFDTDIRWNERSLYEGLATCGETDDGLVLEGNFHQKLDPAVLHQADGFRAAWLSGVRHEMPSLSTRRQLQTYESACRLFAKVFRFPSRCTSREAFVDVGDVRYGDDAIFRIGHQIVGPGFHLATSVSELRNVLEDDLNVAGVRIRVDRLHGNLARLARNERRAYAVYRRALEAAGFETSPWRNDGSCPCLDLLQVLESHDAVLSIT